jgi:hypothetical protein
VVVGKPLHFDDLIETYRQEVRDAHTHTHTHTHTPEGKGKEKDTDGQAHADENTPHSKDTHTDTHTHTPWLTSPQATHTDPAVAVVKEGWATSMADTHTHTHTHTAPAERRLYSAITRRIEEALRELEKEAFAFHTLMHGYVYICVCVCVCVCLCGFVLEEGLFIVFFYSLLIRSHTHTHTHIHTHREPAPTYVDVDAREEAERWRREERELAEHRKGKRSWWWWRG